MKLIYPAVFHQEDNAYWVEFPDLEGCNSFGDTLEETLSNAREALEGYSISLIEHKEKLPAPSDIGSLKTSDGFVSLVDIDLSAYFNHKKAVKKTLTIPEWLNEAAIEKGINFSQAFLSPPFPCGSGDFCLSICILYYPISLILFCSLARNTNAANSMPVAALSISPLCPEERVIPKYLRSVSSL